MRQNIGEYHDMHIQTFAVTVMIRVVEFDGVGYAVNFSPVGISPPCVIFAGIPCIVTFTVPAKLIDRRACVLTVDENGRTIRCTSWNSTVFGGFLRYKITVVIARLVIEHGGKSEIWTVIRGMVYYPVMTVATKVPAICPGTEIS